MRPDPISEFRAGLLLILPAGLAVIPFALLLGAAAAQKGLTPLEMGVMSTMVFAGGSQFVAVDLWTDPAQWLALGFAALLVNLRFVLMTASIATKLKDFSPLGRAFIAFFMADENWAMAERRAAQQPLTVPFLLGLTAIFYLNWVVWTVLGSWIGSAFENPERLGFDFAFTAIFIGLAIGFWKGPSTGIVMAVSGIASALTYLAVDGPWYVMAGAIAGMVAAVLFPPLPSQGGSTRLGNQSTELGNTRVQAGEDDSRPGGRERGEGKVTGREHRAGPHPGRVPATRPSPASQEREG